MFNYERLITLNDGRIVKLKFVASMLGNSNYSEEFINLCRNRRNMLSMKICSPCQILIESPEGINIAECRFNFSDEEDSCELYSIEIYDGNFLSSGVGTLMITEMEQIAANENKSLIKGFYRPYGIFSSHTKNFYERNGYEIYVDKRSRMKMLKKQIGKAPAENGNKSSAINEHEPQQRGE